MPMSWSSEAGFLDCSSTFSAHTYCLQTPLFYSDLLWLTSDLYATCLRISRTGHPILRPQQKFHPPGHILMFLSTRFSYFVHKNVGTVLQRTEGEASVGLNCSFRKSHRKSFRQFQLACSKTLLENLTSRTVDTRTRYRPYTEPDKSSPHCQLLSLRFFNIITTYTAQISRMV
jgi:hypothetical protein